MRGYTSETAKTESRVAATQDSDLRTRVISAVIIGFVTVLTGLLGGPWFAALVLLTVVAATFEMVDLVRASGSKPSLAFCIAATVVSFLAVRLPSLSILPVLGTAVLMASLAMQMRHREGKPVVDWAITIAGGGYLGWTGGHLAAVRDLNNGLWWLVIAIGITWLADSGAYFVGRRFGRHLLAPGLSPRKTWEGYIGGVLCAVAGGAIVGALTPIGPVHGTISAFLVGALGTVGDLAESMFKRQANAKDSGHWIPGHGGAFDRVDSLLWAGVVIFYYVTFVVG